MVPMRSGPSVVMLKASKNTVRSPPPVQKVSNVSEAVLTVDVNPHDNCVHEYPVV